jgi:signal peptidase II
MRAVFGYSALALAAVALDQWIKMWVEANLGMHEQVDIVPFFALYRTYNTGVAFSMFSTAGDIPLIVLSLAVVAFVLFLASRSKPGQVFARVGFALIVGGAIGNLIDRSLLGHVIDYFLFHTPVWSFAVFNLADVFISVGAAMVILEEFLQWLRERRARAADN